MRGITIIKTTLIAVADRIPTPDQSRARYYIPAFSIVYNVWKFYIHFPVQNHMRSQCQQTWHVIMTQRAWLRTFSTNQSGPRYRAFLDQRRGLVRVSCWDLYLLAVLIKRIPLTLSSEALVKQFGFIIRPWERTSEFVSCKFVNTAVRKRSLTWYSINKVLRKTKLYMD